MIVKHFNIDIVLKISLLFGFAVFFLYAVFSGSVKMYVHPRTIPYMIFAAIVMTIIAIVMLANLFENSKERTNSWSLLFYAIPLIMAVAIPAVSFDSTSGSLGNVEISGNSTTNQAESSSTSSNPEETASSEKIQMQNGVIIMTDSNFYECMDEINNNLDKYIGIKIQIVGYVYKGNEEFADDEFVPARLMMVCCAADMVPVGFLCRYNKASEFTEDTWVKVIGTIEKTKYKGETSPYIKAKNVKKTEKPVSEYVYPS